LNIKSEITFEGKVVSFSCGEDTLAMKSITFEMIEGKKCVIGKIPLSATTDDLAFNKVCGVSWDSVTDFIVFDTEQEYSNWIEASDI